MSKVLVLNGSFSRAVARKRGGGSKLKSVRGGKVNIGLTTYVFVLSGLAFLLGAVYLYQVNDISTKGFEVREVENKIQDLKKENKKMQIEEVELRSLENIEKAKEELNLVNPVSVSYLEIKSPMAMK
ncbi:MAG: hypothetical protein COU40_00870 [Candidatus Moranbacteria bacterium CG10_big_fil_rev_8_21_14_0_10_35_21]|nr:MAG: hypothetical protein COU40_00870 [Candidatus Moranbacteria bacterium CG10_big_fil_rev_8_21_14_0_10_35_21]